MSEAETRELVASLLAAFNASDHDALIGYLSEDIAHDVPGADREMGREKIRWRLAALARHFRAEASDVAVMTAPGGLRAAAEFTLRLTYIAAIEGWPAANGQNARITAGVFLEIDDEGLVSRLSACCDPAALRAALAKG